MSEQSASTDLSIGRASDHPHTRDWRQVYARRLLLTDLLVLIWVVFGVQIAWFGFTSADVSFRGRLADVALSYTAASVFVVAVWMWMLAVYETRGYRVVGTGSEEYKLIGNASIRLFGILAIAAYLLHIDLARGYVLAAFPLGILVLMLSRWMWRQWLRAQRLAGRYSSTVLLAGSQASVTHIATELSRRSDSGFRVVGACIANSELTTLPGTNIPVLGGLNNVSEILNVSGADTVIITSSDHLPPKRVRELSWKLEPGRQHLIVVPSLTGVGGPRIHSRPVAGLPLIHVETPHYQGVQQLAKRLFDITVAVILILLSTPTMLIVAIAIKLSSPGPVLYAQERIGLRGQPFSMWKFRSMIQGADDQLASLLDAQGTSDLPLFKVLNDPRITRVGRFIRKYSLDEFPQLFNVLLGSMSLVGPRPQREAEVALYDDVAHRRLLMKPGMSGLWQVSGRSSLSWEDSIRLDLYYVENWSVTGDLVVLWRTFKEVVAPVGAY